jgi:hypothetical protein
VDAPVLPRPTTTDVDAAARNAAAHRALVADLADELGEAGYQAAFGRGFGLDRDRAVELLRAALR